MKKFSFFAAVLAAVTFSACDGGNVSVKNAEDSLAYNFGVANSQGLKMAAMQQGVDTAYMAEFLAGIKEGATEDKVNPAQTARMKGAELGRNLKRYVGIFSDFVYEDDSTKSVNIAVVIKGIMDGYAGPDSVAAAAQMALNSTVDAINTAKTEKKYGANREAGEVFLADNAKKEGVVTTASGLQYKVLTEGKGALPTDESVLKIKYEGRLLDGTVFDSNLDSDKAFEVNMKNPSVIQGWVEVLKLMPAGSKWEVYIPQELAYGERNAGKIEPFSTLIFTIEVLK